MSRRHRVDSGGSQTAENEILIKEPEPSQPYDPLPHGWSQTQDDEGAVVVDSPLNNMTRQERYRRQREYELQQKSHPQTPPSSSSPDEESVGNEFAALEAALEGCPEDDDELGPSTTVISTVGSVGANNDNETCAAQLKSHDKNTPPLGSDELAKPACSGSAYRAQVDDSPPSLARKDRPLTVSEERRPEEMYQPPRKATNDQQDDIRHRTRQVWKTSHPTSSMCRQQASSLLETSRRFVTKRAKVAERKTNKRDVAVASVKSIVGSRYVCIYAGRDLSWSRQLSIPPLHHAKMRLYRFRLLCLLLWHNRLFSHPLVM